MEKNRKRGGFLILVYALTAILFIASFQVYWLYTVYSGQKMQIIKESENILRSYVLNMDSYTVMQYVNPRVPINQKEVSQVLVTSGITVAGPETTSRLDSVKAAIIDSVFSSPKMIKAHQAVLKDIREEMQQKYEGLKFKINFFQNGKLLTFPAGFDDVEGNQFTDKIYSKITPSSYYRIEYFNLYRLVLNRIAPSMVLSLVYLSVCISAVIFLVNSTKKARRLMEMKDDFTNNMTHELKTPLATLIAATEALDKYNVLDDKPVAKEYVQLMQADLKRLAGMAESILYNAKLSAGKIYLSKEILNLEKVFEEVLVKFRPRLEQLEAVVTQDIPSGLNIMADAEHIANVFSNLIDNSLKYSAGKPVISISALQEGDMVKIFVSDNGIGIPQEHQKDIFKPYFRVSEGDRHQVKGYGLGLSYSREIVQLHKGSLIILKSEMGKGTTFEVKLPSGDIRIS